jgi:membrane associated rhomboid family serine protease
MSTMRWGAPPPRGGGGGGGGSYHILGVHILKPIAWLIATVVFMSAFGSLLERTGVPVLSKSVLVAAQVFQGEVWRLVTWAPLELNALGLLFGCLLLYFIGPDLLRHWGSRRFFANFFGGAIVVGAVTSLIARFVWKEVAPFPYLGLWPMNEAMIIAWAALFRDRQILVMFALPMAGRNLIVLTIAMTVVMAALYGFPLFLPHFVAEFVALVYMDVISVRPWIARARLAMFQRRYKKRTARLTRVDRGPDEPPRWTH